MEAGLRERKKALTRRAMVDAAEQLFVERGFANVTLEEIADACLVSVRTLSRYFPSETKESLALAAHHESLQAFERGLAERTGTVLEYWRSYVEWGTRQAAARGDWYRRHMDMIRAEPSLFARHHAIHKRIESLLADALAAESGDTGWGPLLFAATLTAGNVAAADRWRRTDDALDPAPFLAVVDYAADVFAPKLRIDDR